MNLKQFDIFLLRVYPILVSDIDFYLFDNTLKRTVETFPVIKGKIYENIVKFTYLAEILKYFPLFSKTLRTNRVPQKLICFRNQQKHLFRNLRASKKNIFFSKALIYFLGL